MSNVGKIGDNINSLSTAATRKNWTDLNSAEKMERGLDLSFKSVIAPVSIISTTSSVASFLMTNFFKNENWFVDKVASLSNRVSYFCNGIYSGINNAYSNNALGSLGYFIVSLASVIGTEENMYLLKGPGSALDQIPSMLSAVKTNPRIKEWCNKRGDKDFYKLPSMWNSIEKTFVATGIVCSDVVRELKKKIPNGFFKAIWEIFGQDKDRKAEKNLVLSSLGLLTGAGVGLGTGFKRLGASIRDISGGYADVALFGHKNISYKFCGVFYGLASVLDLVYRWTGIEKLNIAAVGLDNAGFCLMSYANADDNRKTRESKQKIEKPIIEEPIGEIPPGLAVMPLT